MKKIYFIIPIVLMFLGIAFFLFQSQTAFGSNPMLLWQYDKLGAINTSGINLDNVDSGKLTVKGCESTSVQNSINSEDATFFIGTTEVGKFNFPNRCIENDMTLPKNTLVKALSLQKSYFDNPILKITNGTQEVDFINLQLLENVECIKDTDCASILRLNLGMCMQNHECTYDEDVIDTRNNLSWWEKIILFLRNLLNLKVK